MLRLWILSAGLILILILSGCGSSSPVLATVGDEKITLKDFEEKYADSNAGADSSSATAIQDRENFLDLLVKYKLKVKEARALGLERDTAIINEINAYRNSVGQSYMLEKEVVDPGVLRLYQLRKKEYRASHIFFKLPPNARPSDTLAAYERAMGVMAQLKTTPFDTLAVKYSEDPAAKKTYGDIGYFVAGRLMPELEEACFSLKVGEYTDKPVRSSYGYHIIKVTDIRPNPGTVHISHILLQFNASRSDTGEIRDTAWTIYRKLKEGANFSEMVRKYSSDRGSVMKDGDIGSYEQMRLPPSVADQLFQIPIGGITEPVRFDYGFHIFKVVARQGYPSFEEIKKDLRNQYQSTYFKKDQEKYSERLISMYNIKCDSGTVIALISSVDSTKEFGTGSWRDTISAVLLRKPIIYCKGEPVSVDSFITKAASIGEFSKTRLTPVNFWSFVSRISDLLAYEEHAKEANKNYPALTRLMKEYEEGVLLYRLEQDEVWKKTMVNDSLLREYYERTKENYRWPDRVNFAEIYVLKDSTAKAIYKQLRKKPKNFSSIAAEKTNRPAYREKKGEWGFQVFEYNDLSRKASKMAVDSISEPFKFQTGYSIIKTLAIDRSRIKTFEEAMPEVASLYQDAATKERERVWIDSLMKKYPIEIHKELLAGSIKGKQN